MNFNEISILAWAALSIGFVHTLLGPDHYLPFIVLAKTRNWSLSKTGLITVLCGIGHVLGSVVLGLIGISFGIALSKIEVFESVRGNIAGYMILIFGFTYFVWGMFKAVKNKPHSHVHFHQNGLKHEHDHKHETEHIHMHHDDERKKLTPWILFIIFVFGPCEPLIPILMYPAAKNSLPGLLFVTCVFAISTIATMLILVLIGTYGLAKLNISKYHRYSHAFAGLAIFLSGFAIIFLGL